ncbi:sugar phosphate nucleotidyltransferase [Vulcanisaeta thermophila]|uniref:sugar phosphate nucleotidyltransferase n=1 Tax=Vulcanisaeta thermophila TaxID=867917 RepID=UPI00085368A2|nr:NDP-sugar synthase [Vulcanisaeta thermophila]
MAGYDVIILAGGLATRLRPLTYSRPKPLLPILNKEILDWIMESLVKIPINRIFISIRYMGDLIRSHVESVWGELRDRIIFVTENKPLGDAGPILLINDNYELTDTFLVVYGDIFSNVNIQDLLNTHVKRGGIATITLTRVDDVSRYGVAQLDDSGRIVNFVEKPRQYVGSNLINAGYYVFTKDVIKYIPRVEGQVKLAVDVIPKVLRAGNVYSYIHNGLWYDIGTPEDYMKANFIALSQMCSDGCVPSGIGDSVKIQPPVYIAPGVDIMGEGEIGPNVIIHRNVKVSPGVKIVDSIIFDGTIVSMGTYISGAIIGSNSYIGKWVRIESGAVLGDGVYVKDFSFIARNTKIGPYREVTESIYREGEVIP